MSKIDTKLLIEAGFAVLEVGKQSLEKTIELRGLNADYIGQLEGFESCSESCDESHSATLVIRDDGDIDCFVIGHHSNHAEWGIDPNSTKGQRLLADAGVLVSKGFGEGQLVDWVDPDGEVLSGPWVIKAVESESWLVEASDTLVFIANEAGSECQAFASEIIQHFEPEDQSAMLVIRPDGRVVRADKNGSYAVYEEGERS